MPNDLQQMGCVRLGLEGGAKDFAHMVLAGEHAKSTIQSKLIGGGAIKIYTHPDEPGISFDKPAVIYGPAGVNGSGTVWITASAVEILKQASALEALSTQVSLREVGDPAI